jgi:hypothetical protein
MSRIQTSRSGQFDRPSTLISGLGNTPLAKAARKLDAKLIALAEQIAGELA